MVEPGDPGGPQGPPAPDPKINSDLLNMLKGLGKSIDALGTHITTFQDSAVSMVDAVVEIRQPDKLSDRTREEIASEERPAGAEGFDEFKLTGQELYNPTLILTRGMEEMMSNVVASFGRDAAIEKIDQAMELMAGDMKAAAKKQFEDQYGEGGEADKAYEKWLKDADEQEKDKNKIADERIRRIRRHDNKFLAAFGPMMRIPLAKFTQYLVGVVSRAGQLQMAALKFNKTFSDATSQAASKMADMPGSLEQKMSTLFDFESEGLEQVGKNTLTLAARMKITGQNHKALISLEKKLLNQGGMSLNQFDALAGTLDHLSKTYTMSTDLLIDSIGQLDQSLALLMVGGGTDEVANALAEATAMFPSMGKEFGKFADAFATADIGQLGILGNTFQDLEKFASGQIRSGDDFIKIVDKIANSSRRLTNVQGVVGKSQMLEVVGPLGVAAMRMQTNMENFEEQWNSVGNTANRIMTHWETSFNTMLVPFEETITNLLTSFMGLAGWLKEVNDSLKNSWASFLQLHHVVGTVLIATLLTKVVPALQVFRLGILSTVHGLTRDIATWMVTLGGRVGVGVMGGVMKFLFGPLGIALILWSLMSSFFGPKGEEEEQKDKDAAATAKNTARLVEIARDRDRISLGTSRFERLTQKLIQDSLFSQAAQESLLARGLPELIEYARVTAANSGTPIKFESNVPTRGK